MNQSIGERRKGMKGQVGRTSSLGLTCVVSLPQLFFWRFFRVFQHVIEHEIMHQLVEKQNAKSSQYWFNHVDLLRAASKKDSAGFQRWGYQRLFTIAH
jgi:hypothetical protein